MESANDLTQWFARNIVLLLLAAGLLVVAYAYSGPIVEKVVRRTLRATEGDFSGEGVEDAELQKRSATIVSLVTTLIRLAIIAVAVLIFVGLTGSEWLLLLVGLFLAGIAIAGQSIVLDYLMGILIIVEGQYFQGDNIELGDKPWKGTVESVGLRRTVVRGVDGTVYSISNGELRSVANRTRIYAAGEVRVRGIRHTAGSRVAGQGLLARCRAGGSAARPRHQRGHRGVLASGVRDPRRAVHPGRPGAGRLDMRRARELGGPALDPATELRGRRPCPWLGRHRRIGVAGPDGAARGVAQRLARLARFTR